MIRNRLGLKNLFQNQKQILKGTLFELKKYFPDPHTMILACYWLAGLKSISFITAAGHLSATLINDLKYCREREDSQEHETQFGENKYHREHPVIGAWVLKGV
ncbi:hypothetical protein HZS_1428 [Henneguya salminicola]|nr:hypothetical protein HZS_1428 [Henneguya salminicola]